MSLVALFSCCMTFFGGAVQSANEPETTLQSRRDYVRLIEAVSQITVEINSGDAQLEQDPDLVMAQLHDFAPMLAADAAGQRTVQMANLALARLALAQGDSARAMQVVDRVVLDLDLAGQLETFDTEGLGPSSSELFVARRRALQEGERVRLQIDCIDSCRMFVNERRVNARSVVSLEIDLPPGDHWLWVETDERPALRRRIHLQPGQRAVRIAYGEPPAPRVVASGAIAADTRSSKAVSAAQPRMLPRWAEVGLVVAGLGGAGVGAGLWALDGRCPGGADASDFDSCPRIYNTDAAATAALVLGGTAVISGIVVLAIDERRIRRRPPRGHALALRPGMGRVP